MPNTKRRVFAVLAATAMASASLAGAPASAQTTDPSEPPSCYWTDGKNWYSCCNIWDACTPIWYDAPDPPEEPSESPEK
jgi:hypothetical protein